jgi:hypothetical protein
VNPQANQRATAVAFKSLLAKLNVIEHRLAIKDHIVPA